jgi:hypothetical protein
MDRYYQDRTPQTNLAKSHGVDGVWGSVMGKMTALCFSLHDTRWTWRLTGRGRRIVCYYRGDTACCI